MAPLKLLGMPTPLMICCVMAGISTGITVGATFLLAVWGYDNSICEKTGSSNVCAELHAYRAGLAVLGLMVGSKGSV